MENESDGTALSRCPPGLVEMPHVDGATAAWGARCAAQQAAMPVIGFVQSGAKGGKL